jgi:hypothetical protein
MALIMLSTCNRDMVYDSNKHIYTYIHDNFYTNHEVFCNTCTLKKIIQSVIFNCRTFASVMWCSPVDLVIGGYLSILENMSL